MAPAAPVATSDDDDSDSSGAALGLGVAGLLAGLVGAVLGGLALARTRRPEAPAAGPDAGASA